MKNKIISFFLGIALVFAFCLSFFSNNVITYAEQLPEQFASGFNTVSLNTYEYNFSPSDYVDTVLCIRQDFYFDNSNYPTSENITIGVNTACIVHARCDAPVFDFPSNELTNINGYNPLYNSSYYKDKYYFISYNGGAGSSLPFYINSDYYDMEIYLYYPLEIEVFCFPLIYSQMYGYDTGYALGDNDGYFRGYDYGFQEGEFYWKGQLGNDIENAYNNGYKKGIEDNQPDIYNKGKDYGFTLGYDEGIATANQGDFVHLVSTIVGAPIEAVKNVLNFKLLGFDMLSFFTGLITLVIVIKIVKLVI